MYLLYKSKGAPKGTLRDVFAPFSLKMLNAENKDFGLGNFSIDYIDENGDITVLTNQSEPNFIMTGLPLSCVDAASTSFVNFYDPQGVDIIVNPKWGVLDGFATFEGFRVDTYSKFFLNANPAPTTSWTMVSSFAVPLGTNSNGSGGLSLWHNVNHGHPSFYENVFIESVISNATSYVNGRTFQNTTSLEYVELLNHEYIPIYAFVGSAVIEIQAVNTIRIQGYNENDGNIKAFQNTTRLALINMPKLEKIGQPHLNHNAFYLLTMGCTINVAKSMETCNNGQPDADLLYAINSRGAIVNYI